MAKTVANVSITTDTFSGWVTKTNVLLDALTNEIVTVSSGTSGSNTSGNGSVLGILAANTLSTELIRGGAAGNTANVRSLSVGFANSTVSSNVSIAGYTTNVSSNSLNITANTTLGNGSQNVAISTANLSISTNTFSIVSTSNISIDASAVMTGDLSLNNYVTFDSKVRLYAKTSNLTFPNNATTNTVDTFSISEFTGAKYSINITDNSNANNKAFTELSVIYGFSNAHMTEYGTIYTDSQFATFSASANSTHVILSANTNVSGATFRVFRTTFV